MASNVRLMTICMIVALPIVALAELPSPQLQRIEPLGLNAGGQVELTYIGADTEGTETLIFDHPGLKAEFVKDKTFKVTVGQDVPAGTYDIRAVGRFGMSNPRLFAVSRQFSDVAEVEPNNTIDKAQLIAVNSAINGQSDGNSQDMFRVSLGAGQRILIDCLSSRLDTELDGTLVLYSADGRQLASNGDYIGRDPQLDFTAPAAGDYVIELCDLTYRGGYAYRLIVSDKPSVENVFPRAVQAGQSIEITAFGRNLGAGSQPTKWQIGDVPLDAVTRVLNGNGGLLQTGTYRFREHPTHHSVLPTAATCTIVGEQFAPFEEHAFSIVVTDTPTMVEVEPNDAREQAMPLTLPAMISGRFDRERDLDWYTFETDDAGVYGFDVYCERIAGRADPFLSVTDEKGNQVGQLDDFGHRVSSFDGHLRDPSGTMNLSAKTKYHVLVKDIYQRGGARYQYVLSVRKARPDFFVACIPSEANMAGTTVRTGGTTWLDVIVHARDGYNDPITISGENLPAGLHIAPLTINNDQRGTLVLWGSDDAKPSHGSIQLIATGKRGDEVLRREVRSYSRTMNQFGSRPTRELAVAIRELAPVKLSIMPEQVTVEAGQKAEVKLRLIRQWPEFTGSVNFQPLNFPGQFQLGNGTIQPGQTEVPISINVQAGTRPGNYSLVVMGQSQVPFNKDPKATEKPNTLVSTPSLPLSITVTEPPKK